MQQTPRSERLHVALYGRRNSGKSSLINRLTGQETSLVSATPGTTTDPVAKAIELPHLGACVLVDTAGYDDDQGELGGQRVGRALQTLERVDIALVLVSAPSLEEDAELAPESRWLEELRKRRIPFAFLVSQSDLAKRGEEELCRELQARLDLPSSVECLALSSKTGQGLEQLHELLPRLVPEDFGAQTITRSLVRSGDVVLLVMPQDQAAPKGRLILPQVQTTRELLDKGCIIVSCTPERLEVALAALNAPPKLIITDSQAFGAVYALKPEESLLTSFSILFAAYKGDIALFVEGAKALDSLSEGSRVLIAEACSHAPATEDIGRVKIPALLRKRYGEDLGIDIVSGMDYPEDLSGYDLIIHCGACMFNRAHVLRRTARASAQQVPITNYGICLAHLTGILDKVSI